MSKKEWSKKEVALAHNYDKVEKSTQFVELITFINEKYKDSDKKLKILDIGCGNGRACLSLIEAYKDKFDYIGTDINKECIRVAQEFFDKADKRGNTASFCIVDADELPWPQQLSENHFDICIFDSTINMVEDPKKVLESAIN